jgi:hypothetical protein
MWVKTNAHKSPSSKPWQTAKKAQSIENHKYPAQQARQEAAPTNTPWSQNIKEMKPKNVVYIEID